LLLLLLLFADLRLAVSCCSLLLLFNGDLAVGCWLWLLCSLFAVAVVAV
jgi:hypothetical protein